MEQELPSAAADPFAPSAAEVARQTILRRLTVGVLLVAGLAGVWVLIDTLPADAPATPPAKAAKAIRQTGGVIPAEQHTIAVPAAPAVTSSSLPTQPPSTPPMGANENAQLTEVGNPAPPATVPTATSAPTPAMRQPEVAAITNTPMPSVTQQPPASPPTASKTTAAETAPDVSEAAKPAAPARNKTTVKQSTAKKPPASSHAGEQFAVQMGVFKVIDNAEKLRAKMALSDIPVLFEKQATETRVLAGPFATRAQALQARDDMEKSGLGKGMLVPLKK